MPATAPFLSGGWVLRTAHRHAVVPARDADVATDALADVLLTAAVDLVRQKGIGDGGARRTDEVEHAAANLPDHGVRGSEAANADHGFRSDRLHEVDHRLVAALGREARGRAVGG